MFTRTSKFRELPIDCSRDPLLVNKLYKHRTLAEILSEARKTGIPPLPTRAGVYTGEAVICRDVFDKIDQRENMMLDIKLKERELSEAEEGIKTEADKATIERMRAEIKAEIEAQNAKSASDA